MGANSLKRPAAWLMRLFAVLLALLAAPLALAADAPAAKPPGDQVADYWREVRQGVPGLSQVQGAESGVLINAEGQAWRDLRNGPIKKYGGTILLAAHRGIESITLDRGAAHLKDQIMPQYAELIYNGYWFSPEREMLQALIDKSQEFVSGTVRLKLYKGTAYVVGRWSDYSLYSEQHVTFEDDAGAYDQKDAAGFIKINALRLRLLAMRNRRG